MWTITMTLVMIDPIFILNDVMGKNPDPDKDNYDMGFF